MQVSEMRKIILIHSKDHLYFVLEPLISPSYFLLSNMCVCGLKGIFVHMYIHVYNGSDS